MNLREKLRHYWHDIYYLGDSKRLTEFGMRCKDISEKIDLGQIPKSGIARFRFYLHISLCQACANYLHASRALKQAILQLFADSKQVAETERLNQELLKKYASRK